MGSPANREKLAAVLEAERHVVSRPQSQIVEHMRETVGVLVQLGEGDRLAGGGHHDRRPRRIRGGVSSRIHDHSLLRPARRVVEAYDRAMRFGISVSSTHAVADHRDGSRWMSERARAANAADLDHICLGDGHARASPYYQGVPTLARMLAEWDTSRPAGCLFLLPLWHPVIVAEQVATLATMLDAPFLLQTGVGGGAAQFDAMGADLRNRGRDLDESIRVIKGPAGRRDH